jgi:Mrp family chromosome partitioning ATPase
MAQTLTECTHDCQTCETDCRSRTAPQLLKQNELSNIKRLVAVQSGKGGVGKSLCTALLAPSGARRGLKTAVLDADVTGPSIPKMFGLHERATVSDNMLFPQESSSGVRVMSLNLLLENPADPVVWRFPMVSGILSQFWQDVAWGDVDIMFIDMPPGTGDIPLTVYQQLPMDAVITVTTPQEVVSLIVEKSIRMAELMGVALLGIIENMSYYKCSHCGNEERIFGESRLGEICGGRSLPLLGRVPLDPKLSAAADQGTIELYENEYIDLDKILTGLEL